MGADEEDPQALLSISSQRRRTNESWTGLHRSAAVSRGPRTPSGAVSPPHCSPGCIIAQGRASQSAQCLSRAIPNSLLIPLYRTRLTDYRPIPWHVHAHSHSLAITVLIPLLLLLVACFSPATPTPIPRPPADYTDEELLEITREHDRDAVALYLDPPDQDTVVEMTLRMTADACEPDIQETRRFARFIQRAKSPAVKSLTFGLEDRVRLDVERLPDRDDVFWSVFFIRGLYSTDGIPPPNHNDANKPRERELWAYEHGWWVPILCEDGIAAVNPSGWGVPTPPDP